MAVELKLEEVVVLEVSEVKGVDGEGQGFELPSLAEIIRGATIRARRRCFASTHAQKL